MLSLDTNSRAVVAARPRDRRAGSRQRFRIRRGAGRYDYTMAVPMHGNDAPRAWVAGLLTRRMLIEQGRSAATRYWRSHDSGVAGTALGAWGWRSAFTDWSPVGNDLVTGDRRHVPKM